MKNAIDTAAIESLRRFALANNELAFAYLCTAALPGWAPPGGARARVIRPTAAPRIIGRALHQDVIDDAGVPSTIPVDFLRDQCAQIQGETWAIERVTEVFRRIAEIDWSHRRDMTSPHSGIQDSEKLDVIRATGITRPDGAIARQIEGV